LALLASAKLLKEKNIPVLFYLTPVDWISGETYWPRRLRQRVTRNAHFIVTGLTNGHARILDLSQLLAPEFFSWRAERQLPNEHLTDRGRSWLAQTLGQGLLPLLYPPH
jgi:hypothetical protein